MKREVIIGLCILLLLPIVNAQWLNVTYPQNSSNVSQPINLSAYFRENTTIQVQVTNLNNLSYPLANITCTNLSFIHCGQIDRLEWNQSAYLNVSAVMVNETFSWTTFIPTLTFLYLIPQNEPVKTINITVKMNGSVVFNPSNITINQNDTIVFYNDDLFNRTATAINPSGLFDGRMQPTQTFTRQFDELIENLEYYDIASGRNGYIHVINRTRFNSAHNSAYDTPLQLLVESKHRPSTLNISIFIPNYTMNYNDEINGVFEIQNVMNQTAYHVSYDFSIPFASNFSFSSPTFRMPNADMNVSEKHIILFKIKSLIGLTNDTGKVYTANLLIKGDNLETLSVPIEIGVNYFNLESNDSSQCTVDWANKLKFCREFPTSQYCISAPILQNVSVIEYRERNFTHLFTETEINDLFNNFNALNGLPDRMQNRYQDTEIALSNTTTQIGSDVLLSKEELMKLTDFVNQTYIQESNKAKTLKFWLIATWVGLGFLILAGIIVWFLHEAKKKGEGY